MLHGHTKIILEDVNTKEQQIYEDDNFVTNAFEELIQQRGIFGNVYKSLLREEPSANEYDKMMMKYLTGGIILFDGTFPEGEEGKKCIYPPAGISQVGMGRIATTYTGEQRMAGSYNNDESGWLNNHLGYRHVWDFTTNQANGDIASVSLTTATGGIIGQGSYTKVSDWWASFDYDANIDYDANPHQYNPSIGNYNKMFVYDMPRYFRTNKFNGGSIDSIVYKMLPLSIDGDKNIFILIENMAVFYNNLKSILNKTSTTKEIPLDVYRFPISNLSLFDTVNYYGGENNINNGNSFNYLGQKSFTIPEGIIEDFGLEENTDFYLTTFSEENYRYFILAKSMTIKQNDYWYVLKINMNNLEVEYFKVANYRPASAYLHDSSRSLPGWVKTYSDSQSVCEAGFVRCPATLIAGDYLISCFSDGVWMVNINNNTDVHQIEYADPEATTLPKWDYFPGATSINGKIYFGANSEWWPIKSTSKTHYGCVIDPKKQDFRYLNGTFSTYFGYYIDINNYANVSDGAIQLPILNTPIRANWFLENNVRYGDTTPKFSLRMPSNFLMTINNLSTKIKKTSNQTMKVIYTITEDPIDLDALFKG